jgi:DNA-binding transcriptional LysR family regulator
MTTPLKWLRSFEAIARLGNMTLAAQEVGLSQAALSQQMRALETHLKLQLFIREPRGVSLTASGQQFYSDISPGLEQVSNALRRYRQPQGDRLRILCNASFALRWLLPNLPGFHAAHPDIRVETRTALWRPDRQGYDPDVEIFLGGPAQPMPAKPLVRCPLVAVGPPGEMSGMEVLPVIRISGQDSLFEAWLASPWCAKRQVRQVLEVDSVDAALSLASSGVGWTLAPAFLAAEDVGAGGLQTVRAEVPSPERAYWAQTKTPPTTAAEIFLNWITGEVAAFAAENMAGLEGA